MTPYSFDMDKIIGILQTLDPKELNHEKFKKSAVLILIIKEEGGYKIVMTSRSKKLSKHSGEMSFPGGKFDILHDKDLKDTALRETCEEIGISREKISILGRLDDFPTITGFIIRPFIGLLENGNSSINFNINQNEVAHLVKIPLEFLFTPHLFMERTFPNENVNFNILSFIFKDSEEGMEFLIWGASAHLLSEFLSIIFNYEVRSSQYTRPSIESLLKYREKNNRRRSRRRERTK